MPNSWFQFKQFRIDQGSSAMKVTTDACLFGAWVVGKIAEAIRVSGEGTVVGSPSVHRLVSQDTLRLLDIGTGTGLLSLMVAQRLAEKGQSFMIDAIEIEHASAAQATANASASPWPQNIRVIEGDVTLHRGGPYDIIFSNPPFYQGQLNSPDAGRRLAHHDEGLSLQQLIARVETLLASNGTFCLLLPFSRKQEVQGMIMDSKLTINEIVEVRPSVRHEPFRLLIRGKRSGLSAGKQMQLNHSAIKEADDVYTDWFKGLLKDYYLTL